MKAFLFLDKYKSAFFNTYKELTGQKISTNNIINTPKRNPEYTIYVPNDEDEFILLNNEDWGFQVQEIDLRDVLKQLKNEV